MAPASLLRIAILLLSAASSLAQPGASGNADSAPESSWKQDLSPQLKQQMQKRLDELKEETANELRVISESGKKELQEMHDRRDAAETKAQHKLRQKEDRAMLKEAKDEESLQHALEHLKDRTARKQERLQDAEKSEIDKLKTAYEKKEAQVLDKFQHQAEHAWIDQFPRQPEDASTLIAELGNATKHTSPVNQSDDWWNVLSSDDADKLKSKLEAMKDKLEQDEDAIVNKTQKKIEETQKAFSRKETKAVNKLTKKIEKMEKKEISAKEKLQKTLEKLENKSKSTQQHLEEVGPEIAQKLEEEYEHDKAEVIQEFKKKAAELKKQEEEKEEELEKMEKMNATNASQEEPSSVLASFVPMANARHGSLGIIVLPALAAAVGVPLAVICKWAGRSRTSSLKQPLMPEDVETPTV
mmetsp:Transcript_51961/g.97206  ORF Transcript_51961/g.97206 Transcript_51961/m.97206 type:complete len:413 (-) Transcript_51961:238-1476(-)